LPDRTLFVLACAIVVVGIILSYTLTSYTVILFGYNDFHFALRQMVFGVMSIGIIWSLAQLNPDPWLHRFGLTLFFGGIILMAVMPFLPSSLVTEVGGAKRWIKFLGFSLAPVEFFKVGFVYFLAWSFSRKLGDHKDMGIKAEMIRFLPYAFIFLVVMFLIAIMQNDLGQVVVLGLTLSVMLVFAGSSFKFFMTLMTGALGFFLIFIFTAEHRILRIKSWWASAQDSILSLFPEMIAKHLRVVTHEEPYQIGHSLNAIHNGGIFGSGFGNGTFKLGFLSEVHTDFVLAGLAEEFGFLGVVGVTFLFLWLLYRMFRIANRTTQGAYYLFSVGFALTLAFAFLINAYGMSGLTPIKGISVPLLSYGGSSMLAAAVGIGMVLMVSRSLPQKRRPLQRRVR